MAKRVATRRKPNKQQAAGPSIRPEFIGTLLLILAGLTAVSLITPNLGFFGAGWLQVLTFTIGWGQYVFWIVLTSLAVWFFRAYSTEDSQERWEKPVGTLLVLAILLIAFHLIEPGDGLDEIGGGGIIGLVLGEMLRSTFGTAGTLVLLASLIPIIFILISGLSFRELFQAARDLYFRFQDWRHFRQLKINNRPVPAPQPPLPKTRFIDRFLPGRSAGAKSNGVETDKGFVIVGAKEDENGQVAATTRPVPQLPASTGSDDSLPADVPSGSRHWRLPPVDQIFDEGFETEISEREIHKRVKIIEDTLREFNVPVQVREINPGPAVTRFSLSVMSTRDPKGNPRKVRVQKIVNLSNDLALALSAAPIRIEAPIPGQPYVGIEVPNSNKNIVTMRGLLQSEKFQQAKGPLRLALGQNVAGQPFVADLASMPHLLIAGATGSGKSVCVNSIISCLISFHTPETLRFLMIDPKMVELVNYNGIPHLLAPVVTELEKATGVLSWATREMDRRYKLFAKERTRNLEAYNERMRSEGGESLPYIVIIIDELADLMMMAPDEVERTVARIAQMARATGMHLILATQRPSVDVVTGLIKANFPARIAFAVSSQIDSRVILDSPGADRLLGKGDMLYMAADSAKLQRLQGVFVSDVELNRLVHFWRGSSYENDRAPRGPVEMPGNLVQQPLIDGFEPEEKKKDDDLLEKAIITVREEGKASVSLLQRRLRIGYSRAARLIDEMEAQGIIGPEESGGRGRQILVSQADDEADLLADEDDDFEDDDEEDEQ